MKYFLRAIRPIALYQEIKRAVALEEPNKLAELYQIALVCEKDLGIERTTKDQKSQKHRRIAQKSPSLQRLTMNGEQES